MALQLKSPHSVLATLQTRPKAVRSLHLPDKDPSPAWEQVRREAAKHRIPLKAVDKKVFSSDKGLPAEGRVGVAYAEVEPRPALDWKTLLTAEVAGAEGSSAYGLWLALDSLQDPHNVGAIFRTAAFFGVRGILMTSERSASLTGTAYDVASGGVEEVPFALCTNLAQALDIAKAQDIWVLGTSEHAKQSLYKVERDRNWLMVIGNEEKGIRRLTSEKCDLVCQIPQQGRLVGSLNVGVAAGIAIAHFARG